MAQIIIPFGSIVDDSGAVVAGATVTIASVKDPTTDTNIASHGATVALSSDGLRCGVLYDVTAKGEAWITLAVSKVGSTITGVNASPVAFAAADAQSIATGAASAATAASSAGTAATQATTAATQATAANGKLTTSFTNMVTRFLTMVESYSGGTLWQFVAGALSQAPTGGGGGNGGYQVRPGLLCVVLADGVAAINEIILNQGEVTWVESRVVDEEGVAISLDGATLGIVLTGAGGYSQELEAEQIEKVLDGDDVNIDGRFRWLATNALGEITGQSRRNVRLTLTIDRGSTSKRSALARIQVVA